MDQSAGNAQSVLLAALALQYDWGADEALQDRPWAPLAEAPFVEAPPVQAASAPVQRPASPAGAAKKEPALEPKVPPEDDPLRRATDLPALIQASAEIRGLHLARTAMNRLAPILVDDAPFLLIGETPDADEDRSGVLFSGQAGTLLDKILASIGRRREELSMAPVIPWRPPGGRNVTEAEKRACLPLLHRLIVLARPPCIVTMGATPAQMLLGEPAALSRIRGKWSEISLPDLPRPVPVLPLHHPLQLLTGPTIRRNLWKDLLLLAETLEKAP